MITFLNTLNYAIMIIRAFIVYEILKVFFPMRGKWPIQVLAFFMLIPIANVVIFANDSFNILAVLLIFFIYLLSFYRGTLIQKFSLLMVLYPMIVSLNYLSEDIGMRIFFALKYETGVFSTMIHTISMAFCPIVWYFIWRICHKFTLSVMELLNTQMWLLLDSVCTASLISLLMVLNYLPENTLLFYPVGFASIITVFGSLYLTEHIAASVQTTYELEVLQTKYEYYENKRIDEQRVRSIYHDLKNHLLLLQTQIHHQESEQMLSSLQEQIQSYENYYKTGNEFLDIILRDKAEKARQLHIDFSIMLHMEDATFLAPLDISTIFGNALDNAMEASEKLPVHERLITAKSNRIRDMLFIVIENNTAEPLPHDRQTSKPDNFLHGHGLQNIKKASEKYGGECYVEDSNGRFSLKIVIPIPETRI